MSEDTERILARMVNCLDEVVFWLRFQGKPKLREVLLTELNTDAKCIAYEMTDGEHSRRDVARAANVSDDNVQRWWKNWYRRGIVIESEHFRGRPKRIISLEELDIQVPRLRTLEESQSQKNREGGSDAHGEQ
jgi:transposase-like protein